MDLERKPSDDLSSQTASRCDLDAIKRLHVSNTTVATIAANPDDDDDDDDCDLDDFEDALDVPSGIPFECDIKIEDAIEESQLAIQYFFNNRFEEARNLMNPRSERSMYHSLGSSVFSFLEAMLTFEHKHILEASSSLKRSLNLCNRYRRKHTIAQKLGHMVKRADYDTFTEDEVHAELCFAESLLLRSILTFMEDETLSSFIRGGIKIRACFNSYKECKVMLDNRNWSKSRTKSHFESGVCMGIGSFNLMISLLPARIIKLLEFIGFSGDKEIGITNLEAGYRMEDGIRQILCIMSLLGYHLMVLFVLSHKEGDLDFCENILKKQLTKYPEGVWFLFFQGRLEFMKANFEQAIVWYKKSWHSQNIWPQFHHLCFWELLWVECCKLNWRKAAEYADQLVQHSKWSRTIYSYQKAAILCMLAEAGQLSRDEEQMIEDLLRDAPRHKQRIAGKSLPLEKFTIKKCERYLYDKKSLPLAAIELMFLWNVFKVLRKNFSAANNILNVIETALKRFEASEKHKFHADNKALLLLLKGACLRQMSCPVQALECLETVVTLQKDIRDDTYLVPYAIVEIGLLFMEDGNRENAIMALEDAKRRYTGYSLESRLHFKIHSALSELHENA